MCYNNLLQIFKTVNWALLFPPESRMMRTTDDGRPPLKDARERERGGDDGRPPGDDGHLEDDRCSSRMTVFPQGRPVVRRSRRPNFRRN